MLVLAFNQSTLPRSMTRQEWREVDRWRRVTQKVLAEQARKRVDNLIAFGSSMPSWQRKDLIDRLVNPTLLLGPYQDLH